MDPRINGGFMPRDSTGNLLLPALSVTRACTTAAVTIIAWWAIARDVQWRAVDGESIAPAGWRHVVISVVIAFIFLGLLIAYHDVASLTAGGPVRVNVVCGEWIANDLKVTINILNRRRTPLALSMRRPAGIYLDFAPEQVAEISADNIVGEGVRNSDNNMPIVFLEPDKARCLEVTISGANIRNLNRLKINQFSGQAVAIGMPVALPLRPGNDGDWIVPLRSEASSS